MQRNSRSRGSGAAATGAASACRALLHSQVSCGVLPCGLGHEGLAQQLPQCLTYTSFEAGGEMQNEPDDAGREHDQQYEGLPEGTIGVHGELDAMRCSREHGYPICVSDSSLQPGRCQTISHKGRDIGQHEHIGKRQCDDAPVPSFALDDGQRRHALRGKSEPHHERER